MVEHLGLASKKGKDVWRFAKSKVVNYFSARRIKHQKDLAVITQFKHDMLVGMIRFIIIALHTDHLHYR